MRAKRVASEMDSKRSSGDVSSILRIMLDRVQTLQDDDETRQLVSAFLKLPPKKIYPDYYALIEQPISLAEILKKVAKGSYTDLALFLADITLMYENAVLYNDPDSWIVADARKILDYVEENIDSVDAEPALPEPDTKELAHMCLGVLDEVIAHEFPEDGVLSGPFIYNVDPDEYPEYYTIIDNPTSFENVKSQLRGSLFSPSASVSDNLSAFYNETDLIFTNAQTYNDPSSLIHDDSLKLQLLFKQKFSVLQSSLLGELHTGIKLKIKPPKEQATKLKLTFKGKTESPDPESPMGDEPMKKRRGRKPKKLVEEEQRQAALEAQLKREASGIPESDDDEEGGLFDAFEHNAMGKHPSIPSNDTVFIRRVAFKSNQNITGQVLTSVGSQPYSTTTRADIVKKSFFPEIPISNAATLFEYQFETLGFSSKAYTMTLPLDCSPLVSMKIALHEIIYNLKKYDLVDGLGILKGRNEEDFMVSLFVNDEEIGGGVEMTEEIDSVDNCTKLLSLSYDLKLNYGLNVVNFELRLSPALAKALRRRKTEQESIELGGRHTRHQLQQIKLNWEVEKFTLFVVSLSP